MKLYCVRHGEAQPADQDPQCGLTQQGKQDVKAVALYCQQLQLHIPHLIHSAKLRAKQTAQIFVDELRIEQSQSTDHLLQAEAEVAPLVEMISCWDQDTMIVGHLPFMAKLVSALVLQEATLFPLVQFPPGTVVCLEQFEQARWIIHWVLRPDMVRSANA